MPNELDHQSQESIEMLKSATAYGVEAVKTAVLINGGAAVALLAYLGTEFARKQSTGVRLFLSDALICFAIGACLAGVSMGTAFFAQDMFRHGTGGTSKTFADRVGIISKVLAVVLIVASYFAFFVGILNARNALTG